MGKEFLSEADICDRFISPALGRAGWDKTQWRREYGFTDGRIIVRGKLVARGKRKRADYVLFFKPNLPIALVEAKDNNHTVGAGIQQGLAYAEQLDIPFVFSSNGDGFLFHDRTGLLPKREQLLSLNDFPSPLELWAAYKRWRNIEDADESLILSPNFWTADGKEARYYQQLAINRTLEAVAKGQRRILLAMATGTGKTFTAFNIIWRLWKNRTARRVLFLADRNILVDQTIVNDFKPFGAAMKKLDRRLIDKQNGSVDSSYEIYLALYQAISGGEDRESIYDKFPRDFFDLIVVDECHRGSASQESAWREILDYFSSATHLGLTATPKETKYVSNTHYFGAPVYTYSLKQGIDDGFLAPYKVVRVDLDVDLQGWRPESGQSDDEGSLIDDRIYNQKDFDRSIVFPDRDKEVANRIARFLHDSSPTNKTIVFCQNVDHAERMRSALMNEPLNQELIQKNRRYVVRITGDSEEGQVELDNFIDPKRTYPVIATTSKLLATGVDAQTCHLIVLDQRIQSLTEFKQIIGRGTRLRPDYGKFYFTIMDFRKATELFADPDWDGPALQVTEIDEYGDVQVLEKPAVDFSQEFEEVYRQDDADDPYALEPSTRESDGSRRFKVSGVEFKVIGERVQYYDKHGKLITESLYAYSRRALLELFGTFEDFLKAWKVKDRRKVIAEMLLERGVILDDLEVAAGRDFDAFDLIAHIAFDRPALTRRERAESAKRSTVFSQYGDVARHVLEELLEKYADQGSDTLDSIELLKVVPFPSLGTPIQLVRSFGDKSGYLRAVRSLDEAIYDVKPASSVS